MKPIKEAVEVELQDFEIDLQDFEVDLIHELQEVGVNENEYYWVIFKTKQLN